MKDIAAIEQQAVEARGHGEQMLEVLAMKKSYRQKNRLLGGRRD